MREDRDNLLGMLNLSDHRTRQLAHERDDARTELAQSRELWSTERRRLLQERDDACRGRELLEEELDEDAELMGQLISFAFGDDWEGNWTTADLVSAVLAKVEDLRENSEAAQSIADLYAAADDHLQTLRKALLNSAPALELVANALRSGEPISMDDLDEIVFTRIAPPNTDVDVSVDVPEFDPNAFRRTAVCVD